MENNTNKKLTKFSYVKPVRAIKYNLLSLEIIIMNSIKHLMPHFYTSKHNVVIKKYIININNYYFICFFLKKLF